MLLKKLVSLLTLLSVSQGHLTLLYTESTGIRTISYWNCKENPIYHTVAKATILFSK